MNNKIQKRRAKEIIPQSYAEVFKRIYANPDNIDITTMLISKILGFEYEEFALKVKLLPIGVPVETISGGDLIVSVDTEEKDNIIMLIYIKNKKILEKIQCYSNVYISALNHPVDYYDEILATYQISFNTLYMPDNELVVDEYMLRNDEGYIYTDKGKFICIYLEECLDLWYTKKYNKDKYKNVKDLILLCASMIVDDIETYNNIINSIDISKEIRDKMKNITLKINNDNEIWEKYFKQQEEKRIVNDVDNEEETLEDDILKNKDEMVINLYNNKVSLEVISSASGLSIDEIKSIVKKE